MSREVIIKITGSLGYFLSFLTVLFLFLMYPIISLFTYPLSIFLRMISWILVGTLVGIKFIFIGVIVFIFGVSTYSLILTELILAAIYTWIIYSISEWFGYIFLTKETKIFYLSLASIFGIFLIWINSFQIEKLNSEFTAFPLFHLSLIFLMLSSITAMIGFLKGIE